MINFIDNVLLAGQADKSKRPNIENKPFGTFCTSGGTGARAFMTFGGVYIGGGDWNYKSRCMWNGNR
jgi:hypothetical protein